ncbi:Na(+)/H(+) exchange regulatory cofactor NHE-RF3-like isoform X1 [Gambusia affinis]|uniref:Na(+)/H(+) exchange regulatory cofactor NHE-RF3-like isoform X1 n=1 Tax=Gambusia affinis TaxID=33528 RepID=UPI001CDB56D6|nr:Na(+)/H(+) exchange regulatory cofactor NHE-RF3-like isoform X1 [Gambusia affinis]
MPSKSQYLRPRLCTLHKGDNGYGFHLHGEKGKTGQFIRLVEPDSPAESSGLCAGDRLVFVNGDEVESESHQQVVSRIRATAGPLELIVVDPETEQLLKKHNLKCLKEYVSEGLPLPLEEEEEEAEGEEVAVEEEKEAEEEEVAVEKEDTEADGTENGDVNVAEVENEEEVELEVAEQEQKQEETPRELTPVPVVPDRNGEVHQQVEKKLSISSEKPQHWTPWRLVGAPADVGHPCDLGQDASHPGRDNRGPLCHGGPRNLHTARQSVESAEHTQPGTGIQDTGKCDRTSAAQCFNGTSTLCAK